MARNQYKRRKPTDQDLVNLRGMAISQNVIHEESSADEDHQADVAYSFFSLCVQVLPDAIDELIKLRAQKRNARKRSGSHKPSRSDVK